jgi:DNA-3-methyladenine glycosylase
MSNQLNSILDRQFYARDTAQVALELLGKRLVRIMPDGTVLAGIIVETEAYTNEDPACHAYHGKTNRNAALFGPVGHAYVYFVYGTHFCLNVVARSNAVLAGGVLIRAILPVEGIELMKMHRGIQKNAELTDGPGKLTQALSIDRIFNHFNITSYGELFITQGSGVNPKAIKKTPRIGISAGQEILWRFIVI